MASLSNRFSKCALLSGVALTASMMLAGAASAQDAPPAPGAAPAQSGGVADIVVTAQRRSQTVLSVPLSISAVKGDTLRATGVTDITSLRFNTPGFYSVSGTGYTQIYIRGIGNRISVGADPSVATFIDDVPRTYASLVDDLTNVERVEVLKGAQGGLYGRNSTGGVINIITRQPSTQKFAAEARVSYGSKRTFDANIYINLPLNEHVAWNFTASRKTHDDYVKNIANKNPYQHYTTLSEAQAIALGDTVDVSGPYMGHPHAWSFYRDPAHAATLAAADSGTQVSHMNNQNFWYFDSKLRFEGDGFRVTLQGDYQQGLDANGGGWQPIEDTTPAYGIYQFLSGQFGRAFLPRAYVYPKLGTFETLGSIEHHENQWDYGTSVKSDIDMPGFVLSTITAFRWNHSQFRGDIGVGNVPIAGFTTDFNRRSFYQEVRMVSSGDHRFKWLAGATYYHDHIDNLLASIVLGSTFAPTLATTVTNSFSGYVQGEYNITDQLKLTASVRYITEKKTGAYPAQLNAVYDPNTDTLHNNVAIPAASGATGAHKFLPAVTLSYSLQGGGVVYARFAQGLKTGGVNPVVTPGQTGGKVNAFKPEAVDTYEVGLRTNLFNRRVQFTSAVFYNNYTNLAVTKPGYSGLPFVLFNAGKARTWGAEASVQWQPNRFFTFGANIGYLNAKYISFHCAGTSLGGGPGPYCIPELKVPAFNDDGNTLIQSPKIQGGITANVDYPVTDGWNVAGTLLYSYSSKFFNDDENSPRHYPTGCANVPIIHRCGIPQPAYSLVNLRLGVHRADNRLGVYVNVKNLFNKHYQAFGTSSATAIYEIPGAPRIITGEVDLKF